MYSFITIKKNEKVEVSKFIMRNQKKELLSHSLFSKEDRYNRKWQDVPVNNEKLSSVKAEVWNLRYLIRRNCCWEDCQLPSNVKCSNCHHYVCPNHADERLHIDEEEGEETEDSEFVGEMIMEVLCGHCVDKHCQFACLISDGFKDF